MLIFFIIFFLSLIQHEEFQQIQLFLVRGDRNLLLRVFGSSPGSFLKDFKREKRELMFPVGINGNRLVLLPIWKPRDGKVVFAQY